MDQTLRPLLPDRPIPLVLAGGTILPVAMDLGPWPEWLSVAGIADVPTQLDHGPRRRLDQALEYVWGANLGLTARVIRPSRSLGRRPRTQLETAVRSSLPPAVGHAADAFYNDRVRADGGGRCGSFPSRGSSSCEAGEVTPRRILTTAFGSGPPGKFRISPT